MANPISSFANWGASLGRSFALAWFDDPEVRAKIEAEKLAYSVDDRSILWNITIGAADILIESVNSLVVSLTPTAFKLAATTINQITGIGVNPDEVEGIASGAPGRGQIVGLGNMFLPVVKNMFPVDVAAKGTANRTDRNFAYDNLNAYFGTNLMFQLRSFTIGTVAAFVPEFQLRHLEGLHQTINWAFGFGWLSWAVLSAIMDVTTTKPLKEYYNAQIKPNDYTHAQTIDAYTRGLITEQLMHQIMDNDGIRDDIRANLVEMHLQGLSTGQAHQAYNEGRIDSAKWDDALDNHSVRVTDRQLQADMAEQMHPGAHIERLWRFGNITQSDLIQYFRWQGFRQRRAEIEADLVMSHRLEGLVEDVIAQNRKLFRDCLIQEWELRQVLQQYNYSLAEQNVVVQMELLARKQRTFISVADMARSIKLGLMDASEAIPELLCRGYTPGDAIRELVLRVMEELPECKEVKPGTATLVTAFQLVAATYAVTPGILSPALLRFLQCLGTGVTLLPPTASITVKPDCVEGSSEVELTWETTGATEVHISHGVGRVPLSGQTFAKVTGPTSFELIATNPLGTIKVYAFVRLEQPPELPPMPIVYIVEPRVGPPEGGTFVSITGANFTVNSKVLFGFTPATTTTFIDETHLSAVSPPGFGKVDIQVQDDIWYSLTSPADEFNYAVVVRPPAI